jgi:TetR/AcrR family transcriptional regulator
MREGGTGSTRKEREEHERRALILDVAERLFAEKGLSDASMAEIAREAEFGVGTLYKYFEDKDTLIRSLVRDRMDAHFDELEAVLLAEAEPEEIVARTVGTYLASVKAHSQFFKFFMTSFHPGQDSSGSPVDVAFLDVRRQRVIGLTYAVFQRGIDSGRFAPVGAEALVGALFGMMMSFHMHGECHLAGGWDADEYKEKILRIFFHPVLLGEPREVRS